MNECSTNQTQHFTGCASLVAIGVKLSQLKLFPPIRTTAQIRRKTIKHTPADKLYDALISLLAGVHGLVEITTRLRADPAISAGAVSKPASKATSRGWVEPSATRSAVLAQHNGRSVRFSSKQQQILLNHNPILTNA